MSQSEEDESLKDQLFVIQLRELLEEGKSEEAEKLFAEAESQGIVDRSLWEIVPILAARLTKEDKNRDRSIFDVCDKLLGEVAKTCNPRESLLLILEQIKDVEDEARFRSILTPLRDSLIRSGPSKGIDWCVESIKNYAKLLPQPEHENPQIEGTDAAEDADQVAERLINDYEAILSFLEPLTRASALGEAQETKTRNYLLSLHLSLFGHPFCYLKTTRIVSIFQTSLAQMSLLTGNLLKFHEIITERSLKRGRQYIGNKGEEDEEEDDYSNIEVNLFRSKDNISDLAYSNYYYYLLTSEEGMKNIPQIYNPHYLMHGCFYLSNFMLEQEGFVLASQGLRIAEVILEKIEKSSIGHEVLELSVHHNLFRSLSLVMIYCDADKDRQMALKIFQIYVDRFNMRARYLLLLNLYETADHSGFLSLLTNITKASIIHCLDENCDYFLGGKLERLMKRICRLPDGSATNLVTISDEVIAALNLLRFLTIRDKDNSTGIWKIIDNIEKEYLQPLREGIEMMRAHMNLRIEEEQKKSIDSSAIQNGREETKPVDQEIYFYTGGGISPNMSDADTIRLFRRVINTLDIMESIAIRVNECIEENPLRSR